jgi:capsular polysaccharide biosynthesis protein
METRAYLEGILYRWWLALLFALLSFGVSTALGETATAHYTASTNILINDALLANTAFPSQTIQLNILPSYVGVVLSPVVEGHIIQAYPRLTRIQVEQEIVVTVDATNQVMLITVTDLSPYAAVDIANYVANQFVVTRTTSLQHQLTYYQQWLQGQITTLETQINQLNQAIDAAAPQRSIHGPPPQLTPTQKLAFTQNISTVSLDQRKLYDYQQSLLEVQQSLPLVPGAYVILKQATLPQAPDVPPLPLLAYQALGLLAGLFFALCTCIGLDFFTSTVRHRQELAHAVGLPTFAELPMLTRYEQKRLLQGQPIVFMWRLKPLRLFCASVSAAAIPQQGRILLLTSPRKRRTLAAVLATFLARKGLKTLLIDADFAHPTLHEQLSLIGPANIHITGKLLPSLGKTAHPNLYLLPASAPLTPDAPLTCDTLLSLLPTLQATFEVILIDAPTLDHATTHLLLPKVAQVLMLIRKRRDSLKTLQRTRITCETLKVSPSYVFLT